ncbi:MAG TPA: hypothetical protein VFN53_06375 [Acidobacteriaceae bacterium]|nr:hypothetical protein [Acidobacteriaceae bacterium]
MPQPGYIVAQYSTEDGFGSGAIRYFSDSDYSHVDLVVPETVIGAAVVNGWIKPRLWRGCHEMLLGSRMGSGVQLRPKDYGKFTKVARIEYEVPDIHAAYKFAFAQIGKPYNKGAILDFFLHRTRKFDANQKSWFCDELFYQIGRAGGTRLLNCDNPLDLTPQECFLSPLGKPVRA